MKLKYFIRGLGTGIIFCALIMLAAYMTSDNKISDKEIIERAENLGMVMEEDVSILNKEDTSAEEVSEEASTEAVVKKEPEDSGKEQLTEEVSTETTEAVTTEEATTETTTDTTTEATTEESKKPGANTGLVTAEITVSGGMTSTEVALLLEDAGIIEDYLDFDQYLNDNGYSTQIRINDYTFNNGMTYEQIAKALIKEDKKQ